MAVQNVKITVLIENTNISTLPQLRSKHGLSFFIQSKTNDNEVSVLMDTGPSPTYFKENSDMLNINLKDTDAVVLSHSHYDHTGGLIEALHQIEKHVPIIGHPTLFDPKLKVKPKLKTIGASFNRSDLESVGGIPILATNPVTIASGIVTTGEIPRTTPFESVNDFWTVHNQRFSEDQIIDDQSLVIDVEKKGLVIISGCAHSGIINTIKHAKKITGNNKIYGVLGGFHLMNADNERIQSTVNELYNFDPQFVGPCHCTGKKAIKKSAETFGDKCVPLHTGDTIDF